MINLTDIEEKLPLLKEEFLNNKPFNYVVIDDFCDEIKLNNCLEKIKASSKKNMNKSRDYIFAKNKYEKSDFNLICSDLDFLKTELTSDRFKAVLSKLTGSDVFVDPNFHGGGLHQGGEGSFLDMHVDFNYHPEEPTWFRDLNILLYLNPNWKEEYGGELKLAHKDRPKELFEIQPLFNRAVIMQTRNYTFHGYDPISFPDGEYRRSIATYAYQIHENPSDSTRTTVWYPKNSGGIKKLLGLMAPTLVKIKSKVLPSSTSKNK